MTDQLYEKIPRARLYDHIASHVEKLIADGDLNPGDKLPPERELAVRMQVGRGAVRESIKLLAERGLVEVKPGRGTFVAVPDESTLGAQLQRFLTIGPGSRDDLQEVRQAVEVAIAGLAAPRADADDLKGMQTAIEDMDASTDDPVQYVRAHIAFHRRLAEATRNMIFPMLIDVLVDQLRDRTFEILQTPGAPQRRQYWHRRIYEAVSNQDAEAAQRAMQQHLQLAAAEDSAASGSE